MEYNTWRLGTVVTNLNILFFWNAYVQAFSILHWKNFNALLKDLVLRDLITKILIQVLKLLWMNCNLSFTTPLFSIPKISCKAVRQYLGIFRWCVWYIPQCMAAMPIDSLFEFVFNEASQLWDKVHLCGQHLATDPSSVSSVDFAVNFLPPNMEPNHRYGVSPNPCHLATCVMSCEVLSDASSTPRQCLYCVLWTSFMSLFWYLGFWNGLKDFGKFLDPSHSVYM